MYYNELYDPNDIKIKCSWEIEEEYKNMNNKLSRITKGKKDFKTFVVGASKGYGRWVEGELTNHMDKADLVLFTGGEDISPSLYNEPTWRNTYYWLEKGETLPQRDRFEVAAYKEALKLGKPMWGTCRGAQLLCALAGGKLIQDMDHHGSHKLHFLDDEYECISNSLHHQMQYPYNMDKENYTILAYTLGLSNHYTGGRGEQMVMPEKVMREGMETSIIKEPEFVYYPKIKALGIQGHPEMMGPSDMVTVCHAYLNLLVEEKIDDVLLLGLKVKDIINRAWDFEFTSEEKQLLDNIKRKEVVYI